MPGAQPRNMVAVRTPEGQPRGKDSNKARTPVKATSSPRRPRSAWSAASVLARLKRVSQVEVGMSLASAGVSRLDIQAMQVLAFPLRAYLFRVLFRALDVAQQQTSIVSRGNNQDSDDTSGQVASPAILTPSTTDGTKATPATSKSPIRATDRAGNDLKLQAGILDAFWNERQAEKKSEVKQGLDSSQRRARQRAYAELFMRLVAQQLKALGGLTPHPTSLDLLSNDPSACLRALDWLLYRRARLLTQPSAKTIPNSSHPMQASEGCDGDIGGSAVTLSNNQLSARGEEGRSEADEWDDCAPSSLVPAAPADLFLPLTCPTSATRASVSGNTRKPTRRRTKGELDLNIDHSTLAQLSHHDLYMYARDAARTNAQLTRRNAELEAMLARVLERDPPVTSYGSGSGSRTTMARLSHPHAIKSDTHASNDHRRTNFVNAQLYQLERQVCVQSAALGALAPRAAELEAVAIDLEEEAHSNNNSSSAARAASARSRLRAAVRSAGLARTQQLELGELGMWNHSRLMGRDGKQRATSSATTSQTGPQCDKEWRGPMAEEDDSVNAADGEESNRGGNVVRGPPVVEVCSGDWGSRQAGQQESDGRVDGGRLRSLSADLHQVAVKLKELPTHVMNLIQYLVEQPTAVTAALRTRGRAEDISSHLSTTTDGWNADVLEHLSQAGQILWLPELLTLCTRSALESASAGATFGGCTDGPGATASGPPNSNASERGVGHSGMDSCERAVEAVMNGVAEYVPGRAHVESQVRVQVGKLVDEAREREQVLKGRILLLETQAEELCSTFGTQV
jgi:hypothetical protein